MSSTLSEEQFRCAICLDVFNNPVSIPCGHNFCLDCIQHHWSHDSRHKTDCPICKEVFYRRPDLRVNAALRDITEQFKIDLTRRKSNRVSSIKPVPARRTLSKVPKDSGTTNHQPPVVSLPILICRIHNKPLDMFCKRDRTPVCTKCTEHRLHEVVYLEAESKSIKAQIKKTQTDLQLMVKSRFKKMDEIKNSVEMSKLNRDRELEASAQVFSLVMRTLERNQTLLIDEIEQKHDDVEKRAEEHLSELKQEIRELQRRSKELQQLENTEDPLLLLQNFPNVNDPLPTRDWSEVQVVCDTYIGNIRRSLTKLMNVCRNIERELSSEEFSKTINYAVDVTLDEGTAACWLDVSPDGKEVGVSPQPKRVPDDPRRFDACVSILGEQRFTCGRKYWVVQVGDKTDWDLGVARESINRKGAITVRPDNGYWAICRRKGGSLQACAGPSFTLTLREIPKKVSVFLDYEEGQVSFYNTDTQTHIHSYRGCGFQEPLYPYFNPCLQDHGKNSAPLIICPVSVRLSDETVLYRTI